MYGVSPAFFISLFGDRFSAAQMAEGLARLPVLGFGAYQPEIYHAAELEPWLAGGAADVAAAGREHGLVPTQFVGHFLLHFFGNAEVLASGSGVDEFSAVCEVCREFAGMDVITVPLAAFADGGRSYAVNYAALVEKLGRMGAIASSGGYRIALEVLPGSLLGGPAGLAPLLQELGGVGFGYNLDTGHAWASRANPAWIAESLGTSVLGTHLCDNDGVTNESRGPGRGSIDWASVVRALDRIGYAGSWDIEIHSAPELVDGEYRSAREYLESLR